MILAAIKHWDHLHYSLSQAGYWLMHLHLQSGPELTQRFDTTVILNESSFMPYFQTTALCSIQQMTYNRVQAMLSSATKPSQAQLASIPGRPSVNVLSCAQPQNFCQCKWLHYYGVLSGGESNWITLNRASRGTRASIASGGISSAVMGGSTGPFSSLSSSLDSGMMLSTQSQRVKAVNVCTEQSWYKVDCSSNSGEK